MKKNNKGFSLAELIVVVLILGILAVAVTPQVMNWIDKSKVAKDQNYAGTVATAVESVALEYIGLGQASSIADFELSDSGVSTACATLHDLDDLTHDPDDSTTFCFGCDVVHMIGADKCQGPEQSGMTKYTVDITVTDERIATVEVEPAA